MEPLEAEQCPSGERSCEGAPPLRMGRWQKAKAAQATGRGGVAERGLPPQQKAPWETALSHLLSFFLSLGLSGLKKFSVNKIKSKMRETGAWGGAKNSA